ncbi:SDR family oxidoreductase [Sodalis sp. RH21]|uniref:SDR family oxidoreductase n=1 Tax=unclassified Sodalis (in: enterobacteria) TaxID=2636512 RepID=UPI0039B4A7F9
MVKKYNALVVGSSGIIGSALVETLAADPDWDVRAIRRTPVAGVESLDLDLADAQSTADALAGAGGITHVFYTALAQADSLAEEEQINTLMLRNLLDGLEAADAPLQRVVLYQGAKVYGVHLDKARAPFYEDAPRFLGPNFYYTQQDLLTERAERDNFSWSILRPDVVVGATVGNPMNIVMVMGVFAALSKARGLPLRFPGSWVTWNQVLAQVTDAHWLARASIWAALADGARNEAFNLVGEPFRWERIWRVVADEFAMAVDVPQPMILSMIMPALAAEWDALADQHRLQTLPYDRLVGWAFGDFVFNCEFDMVSDMGKIRRAGFTEPADNEGAVRRALLTLRQRKILP